MVVPSTEEESVYELRGGVFSAVECEVAKRHPGSYVEQPVEANCLDLGKELWDGSSNLRVIIIGGIENGNAILQNAETSGPG